jgi:hypothetical protein
MKNNINITSQTQTSLGADNGYQHTNPTTKPTSSPTSTSTSTSTPTTKSTTSNPYQDLSAAHPLEGEQHPP